MAYPFVRWWLLPLLRRRITQSTGTEFLPRSSAYIVVANHNSWLDSAYLVALLSKYTDKKIFFIASTRRHQGLGALPIDPAQPSSVLTICAEKIKTRHPVVIFPEGNSNPQRALRPGKTGAARLALQTHTPIIPIGIRGTHQPNFMKAVGFFFNWHKPITIRIGQPLLPADKNVETLTRDIMSTISQLSGKPLPHA